MLSLITGVPGSGKTLYAVDKLLPLHDGRLYTNINGLTLPHVQLERGMCEAYEDWFEPGDLIVIDEAQDFYPVRAPTAKIPEFVSWMTKHRHSGVDVILITQHPMLIDPQLRRLVNRHIEVRRLGKTNKAIVYEWDRCSDRVDYKTALAKIPYAYSKAAFNNYKSAQLHTKPVGRLPVAMWIGICAVLFGAGLGGYRYWSKGAAAPPKPVTATAVPAPTVASPMMLERRRAAKAPRIVTPREALDQERIAQLEIYGEESYWCMRAFTSSTCRCGPAVIAADYVRACSKPGFPVDGASDLPQLPIAWLERKAKNNN